jgi:GntR family transcriptional regulator
VTPLPLSDTSRKVVAEARAAVLASGRNLLEPLDLLRALGRTAGGAEALYQLKCDVAGLTELLGPAPPLRAETDAPGPLFAAEALAVLEVAREWAAERKAGAVELEDLLRGVCVVPGPAATLLAQCGVGLARAAGRSRSKGPAWLGLDLERGELHQQIVMAVEEAVATGQLAADQRLPSVRGLAEDLGIATGTVAAAYRELARRGILVGAGVRGTRVVGARQRSPEALLELETTLRAAVLVAFRAGATADEVRSSLERALEGVALE